MLCCIGTSHDRVQVCANVLDCEEGWLKSSHGFAILSRILVVLLLHLLQQ